nr:collagen alpha-1(I) chain-like isoform X1 [Manis javanica]
MAPARDAPSAQAPPRAEPGRRAPGSPPPAALPSGPARSGRGRTQRGPELTCRGADPARGWGGTGPRARGGGRLCAGAACGPSGAAGPGGRRGPAGEKFCVHQLWLLNQAQLMTAVGKCRLLASLLGLERRGDMASMSPDRHPVVFQLCISAVFWAGRMAGAKMQPDNYL